jgi:hypothetical protein
MDTRWGGGMSLGVLQAIGLDVRLFSAFNSAATQFMCVVLPTIVYMSSVFSFPSFQPLPILHLVA